MGVDPMSQTRLGSFAEAWANIAVGFGVNYVANLVILPMVGLPRPGLGQNFVMGCLFTVVSLVRSFAIRRWFNGLKWGSAPTAVPAARSTPIVKCRVCGEPGCPDHGL